jgi:hypothetical protein
MAARVWQSLGGMQGAAARKLHVFHSMFARLLLVMKEQAVSRTWLQLCCCSNYDPIQQLAHLLGRAGQIVGCARFWSFHSSMNTAAGARCRGVHYCPQL